MGFLGTNSYETAQKQINCRLILALINKEQKWERTESTVAAVSLFLFCLGIYGNSIFGKEKNLIIFHMYAGSIKINHHTYSIVYNKKILETYNLFNSVLSLCAFYQLLLINKMKKKMLYIAYFSTKADNG